MKARFYVTSEKYRVYRLLPDVLYLQFEDGRFQNYLMGRMSAHYENPDLRGRVVTHDALTEWNIDKKRCVAPWSGFNLPASAVESFLRLHELQAEETALFRKIGEPKGKGGYGYLISTAATNYGEARTLVHELSHALYATKVEYRDLVHDVVENLPGREHVQIWLRGRGYDDSVATDETAAFITSPMWFREWYRKVEESEGGPEKVEQIKKGHETARKKLLQAIEGQLKREPATWEALKPLFRAKNTWGESKVAVDLGHLEVL